jgi:general L-amino acid transport system permease protein
MSASSTSEIKPPSSPGPIRWLKKNLFSTRYNTLLTILASLVLFFVLRGVINWVFFKANWTPVVERLKLLAVGQYPQDQLWRLGLALWWVSFMFGLSWRVWGGTLRIFALTLAVFFGVVAVLPVSMGLNIRLFLIGNPIMTFLGYQLGRTRVGKPRWALLGWLISFLLTIVLLYGIPGTSFLPRVETSLWGGLLLTVLLAIIGIVASFPIGVALALGRQSSLPVVKGFCIMYIEIIRGVPLVTILFMASIILPLFLPEGLRIDRVMRALLGITLFAAAYMAENIRGGLQAIPRGQVEAAKAVGLSGFYTTALIVLPQALRLVIPTIVGQFIALFMDTTLVLIVGLLELLAIGRAILESRAEWRLLNMEMFVFIALAFWIFDYSMSFASRRLESALGVGER